MIRTKYKKITALVIALVLCVTLAGCKQGAKQNEHDQEAGPGQTTGQTSDISEDPDLVPEIDNETIIPGRTSVNDFAAEKVFADIFVEPVKGISDDFIRGVDISTILAQEASGVKYYDADGNEKDIFELLAGAGVNYVRVRVWNDPYDKNGYGYGGGNCDTATAATIGSRAAEHGMKLMVDYHYSDFWADPKKQFCPKEWEDLQIWDKAEKCYQYTLESINAIMDGGADVGMVQLGNEINKGMSGEKQYSFICQLLNAGAKAVREAASDHMQEDIKIAVHYANPEDPDTIIDRLNKLRTNEVDYDIVGISYYPFWHGTLDNLTELMKKIRAEYGKDVLVAETSYAYTLEDGDGNGNSVDEKDLNKNYAATVQSQVNAVRDVCEAVVKAGGLGVFYWEPAWIPVNRVDWTQPEAEDTYEINKSLWEEYGSGWASSYAAEYDPGDAGKYYGGSAWDNQAWFDFDGKALPSLYTYKYLKYGAECPLKVDFASDALLIVNPGQAAALPETVDVHFNDRSKNGPAAVVWNRDDITRMLAEGAGEGAVNDADDGTQNGIVEFQLNNVGEYYISGVLEDGSPIGCLVKSEYINLLSNPSFEDPDRSMYDVDGQCVDYQQKETDASTGEWAMHYWSSGKVHFTAEQTVTGLTPGLYSFSVRTQGGDAGDSPEMYIYVRTGDHEYREAFNVAGWVVWQAPEITSFEVTGDSVTVGVYVDAPANAWGTVDDFYLCRIGDL
ncbi:MAG: glycosyl hydrolase 53 family protein [Lachnospiraceae bacterium]|nr:glycosyl hydrolase 53 family protein [Lachnospiraceae bacterium]